MPLLSKTARESLQENGGQGKGKGQGKGNGNDQGADPNAPITHTSAMTMRIRRLVSYERDSALVSAARIRAAVERVGRANVDAELGDEAADLVTVYAALKTFILTIDPDADVPDLPE